MILRKISSNFYTMQFSEKTMESIGVRIKIELVSCLKIIQKCINKPTF